MLKIYKASAGSGKTYTLAYEYIRLLLAVKDPGKAIFRLNLPKYSPSKTFANNLHRHILAITFTNKATEEMKRRIIDELDALAKIPAPGDTDANYADKLCSELGCQRDELAVSADHALKQLLYDYHYFNVNTIDAFFQRVLRTFARELDRQGDFSVELSDYMAMQKAVDTMLDDFNRDTSKNPGLEKWIIDYLSTQIERGTKANFFNRRSSLYRNLIQLLSQIAEEKFKPYAEDMRAYLIKPQADTKDPLDKILNLSKAITRYLHDISALIKAKAQTTVEMLAADGIDYLDMKKNSSVRSNITRMLDGKWPKDTEKGKWYENAVVKKTIEGDTSYFPVKMRHVQPRHYQAVSDLFGYVLDLQIRKNDYEIIENGLTQLTLLGYAWRYLDTLVSENNTVLLSDTNHLLRQIIGADETPFIYERLGLEIRHFLIDEFQDTSRMQWTNLKPLVANSMGEDLDSLIIGDEKQSIYRFRNSDSSLLHHEVAETDFPAPIYNTKVFGGNPGENTNYRSAASIVRFNNTLFTHLARLYAVEGYENVIQDIPRKHYDIEGYVHFVPYNKPPKDSKKGSNDKVPPEVEPAEVETAIGADSDPLLKQLAQNILRQRESSYRWADIAILTNTNKEGARVIEYLLKYFPSIPVVSDEALFLRKSSTVQIIIGMLQLFAFEAKPKERQEPGGNLYPSAAEVAIIVSRYHYFLNQGHDVVTAIEKAVDTREARDLQATVDAIKSHKPSSLPSLVEAIIYELICERDRITQLAYISAFQDYVIDYSAHYNPSVQGLLDHWMKQKKDLSVPAAANIDAVRVMTVHKSKGLEFDCVHIPFASWEEIKLPFNMWLKFPDLDGVSTELCPPAIYASLNKCCEYDHSLFHAPYMRNLHESYIDTLNKTYVAYTRAGRELIVYYEPTVNLGKKLTEAFASGNDDARIDTTLFNLPDYFDAATGELVIGEPTQKNHDVPSVAANSQKRRLDRYDVYMASGSQILSDIDDVLELQADITLDAGTTDDDVSKASPLRKAPFACDYSSALRTGLILHDILSMTYTRDDAHHAIDYVAKMHRLDPQAQQKITSIIRQMLDCPDRRVARWFGDCKNVLTEQTIYSPTTGKERRLDRIVINHDGSVDIIDYKFTSEQEDAHRQQVSEYITLLQQMGYSDVHAYLWYPLMPGAPISEVI